MKFFALVALMAVSVAALPTPSKGEGKENSVIKFGGGDEAAPPPPEANGAAPSPPPAANSTAPSPPPDAGAGGLKDKLKGGKAGKGKAANDKAAADAKAAADKAAADKAAADAAAGNATAIDNASNNNATGTASAASATRTRACDMGDQSLAGGFAASVLIGIGQQAAVTTLQGADAAANFTDGVTRLQQFVDTQALQLQMMQAIADDDSLAQPQLKLLTDAATSQAGLVKTLKDAQTSADDLKTLLDSFTASTGAAQDGQNNALIDCFIPLTAVSG